MKLIIDIPEIDYECAKQRWMKGNDAHKMDYYISKGIPLDNVKTEIAEEICLTDNLYTRETKYTIEYLKMLELLDNIGKAESQKLADGVGLLNQSLEDAIDCS